jgi:hypothetical protein
MMKGYGKGVSDADKARMDKMMGGASGKGVSDADKARMKKMMGESGKTISDADKARMGYKKGGKVMAKKMASKKGMKK